MIDALFMFLFSFYRFSSTMGHTIPPRIRIMNYLWMIAYVLILICFFNFLLKRREIMSMGNFIFQSLEAEVVGSRRSSKSGRDLIF
jgi:hypothetical protein